MTVDDAAMNVIIFVFLFETPFKFIYIFYPTHEGATSHMASVHVYLLTS